MNNTVVDYIIELRYNSRKRRNLLIAIAILSLLVAGVVSWNLHLKGVAMSNTACCGMEEHIHTDECGTVQELVCTIPEQEGHTHDESCYTAYTKWLCGMEEGQTEGHVHSGSCYTSQPVYTCTDTDPNHIHNESCYYMGQTLICGFTDETVPHVHTEVCGQTLQTEHVCGQEQSGHTHSDACYTTNYACGKEEHTHTLSCYSDPNADVETAEIWKSTLPALSGDWQIDILNTALSQFDYKESDNNFIVADDGTTRHGITRYGQWYGNPYGEWSSMFVSFVLHYANIPEEAAPINSGVGTMLTLWTEAGLTSLDNPKAGDLVFLDRNLDGICDDVAIVTETAQGIKAIGRNPQTLAVEIMEVNEGVICYGSLNKSFELAITLGVAIRQDENLPESNLFPDPIPDDYNYYEAAYDEGLYVEVCAPKGAFDREVKLFASVYAQDSSEYKEAIDKLEQSGVTDAAANYIALDIHFSDDSGAELEPDALAGKVYVRFVARAEEVEPVVNDSPLKYEIISADGAVIEQNGQTADGEANEGMLLSARDEASSDVQVFHVEENGVSEVSGMAATAGEEVYAEFTVESFSTFVVKQNGSQVGGYDTLAEAFSKAPDGSTIVLMGDSTVDAQNDKPNVQGKTLTLDLNGKTLSFNALSLTPIIDVRNNGVLTIIDSSAAQTGTLKGRGSTTINWTPVVKVSPGGKLYFRGGTITANLNKNAIRSSTSSPGGGVAVVGEAGNRAYFEMSGGTISYCTADKNVDSNGTINDNLEGCGGGIAAAYADIVLSGGTITQCFANCAGGGIYLHDNSTLEMLGGTISHNTADVEGGGGICVGNQDTTVKPGGSTATLKAGLITENSTNTTIHFGGGGVYVHTISKLILYSPYITGNTAEGFGGGISCCSTGSESIDYLYNAAIFGNTAKGQKAVEPNYDAKAKSSNLITNDLYLPNGGIVYGTMLGDGDSNWTAMNLNKKTFTINAGQTVTFPEGYQIGLTAYPTQSDKDKAYAERGIVITNNTSTTNGGGINSNGVVILKSTSTSAEEPYKFNFNKSVTGNNPDTGNPLTPDEFAFIVRRKETNGSYTDIGVFKSDANGNVKVILTKELLPNLSSSYQTYEFKITEDIGSETWMEYDKNQYIYQVDLKESTRSDEPAPNYTRTTSIIEGTNAKWYKLESNGNKTLISQAPTFVNKTKGGLTVAKHFYVGSTEQTTTPDNYDGVFTLYVKNGNNFDQVGNSVPYSQFTNGSYTWAITDTTKQYKVVESGNMGTYATQSATFQKVEGSDVLITDTTIVHEIKNYYDATGKITVKKEVPGSNDDKTDFKFTATLTKAVSGGNPAPLANTDVTVTINGTAETKTTNSSGEFTFTLKKDQTAEISNLPIGAKIKLDEKTTGYTTQWTVPQNNTDSASGTTATVEITSETKNIVCKNTPGVVLPKTGGIGTEVIVLLGMTVTAIAFTLIKKRKGADF